MARDVIDFRIRQRRWNAAALQPYPKRQAPAGFCRYPRDLQMAARDLETALCGSTHSLDLVRQTWEHPIPTALVVIEAQSGEDDAWRLAEAPPRSNLATVGAGVWQ